jgi:cell division protein FtsW (lipid II flippase)
MDEKKKAILKRVLAWVYIILFVFVILNLMILDFYKDIFLFAYIALLIVYFAVFKNKPDEKTKDNNSIKDDGNNKDNTGTKADNVADKE